MTSFIKRTKFGLLFGVLVISLGVYFAPVAAAYFEMRRVHWPLALWAIPRPLTDTTVSDAQGTDVAFYGYQFEAPWKGIVQRGERDGYVDIEFAGGQRVMLFDPKELKDPLVGEHVDAFGSSIPGTKYDHLKAIVSMSPANLSIFRSRPGMARDRAYLEIKGLWYEHHFGHTDIFSINTLAYRGFESSDLAYGLQEVQVTLFDGADRELAFNISTARDSGATITQADVNRIIQSLKPISN